MIRALRLGLAVALLFGCSPRTDTNSSPSEAVNTAAAIEVISHHPSSLVRAALARTEGRPRIVATLPAHADEAMTVRDVSDDDVSLSIVAQEWDADFVMAADAMRAEELRIYRTAKDVVASWRIVAGPAIAAVRAREGRFEAVDARGVVRLSTAPVVAYDARGIATVATLKVERRGPAWIARASFDGAYMQAPIVLDPAWSTVAALADARYHHALVVLADGHVLAVGGNDFSGAVKSTAELFDPTTKTWSAAGTLVTARTELSAALLPSGKVLVAGGNDGSKALSTAEIWDPATKKFTATTAMTEARNDATATALVSGKVLVVAGVNATSVPYPPASTTAELYDEGTGTWSAGGTLARRYQHLAVRMSSGKVLVVSGAGAGQLAEVYDPSLNTWSPTPALTRDRQGAILAISGKGVLVAGGGAYTGGESTSELYDAATNVWSVGPNLSLVRVAAAGCATGSGSVVIAGGDEGNAGVMLRSTAERFDSAANVFRPAGSLVDGTTFPGCASLKDGRVLVVGGRTSAGAIPYSEIFAELADGSSCTDVGECASGVCTKGTCGTGGGDAGTDATATDAISDTQTDTLTDTMSDVATDTSGPIAEAGPPPSAPTLTGDFERCTRDDQCSTGHCVEGVCCDSPCTDRCHSCVLATAPGKCVPSPKGVDFRGECGAAATCSGTCDGVGGCTVATAGAQCAPSRCLGPSTGVGPAVCVATGVACDQHAVAPFDCGNYVCEPAFGTCRTSCSATSVCAGDAVCDISSHTCSIPPPPPPNDCGVAKNVGARAGGPGELLFLVFAYAVRLRARAARAPARTR